MLSKILHEVRGLIQDLSRIEKAADGIDECNGEQKPTNGSGGLPATLPEVAKPPNGVHGEATFSGVDKHAHNS